MSVRAGETVNRQCPRRGIVFHPARPKLLWQLLPSGTLTL
jgi:hypothetical protein